MRSAQILVVAVATLCLASECASTTGSHDPAVVRAGLSIATTVPAGMHGMAWNLIRVTGPEIRVSVSKSGCTFPRGFAVATSKDAVVISAYGQRAAGFCTSDMTTVIQTLTLSDPLGTRRLMHGA